MIAAGSGVVVVVSVVVVVAINLVVVVDFVDEHSVALFQCAMGFATRDGGALGDCRLILVTAEGAGEEVEVGLG